MNCLCWHTQKLDSLIGPYPYYVKKSILNVSFKNVPCHELCGRHIFKRSLGEYLPGHLCLGQFIKEPVFHIWCHFKCMSKTHLLFRKSGHKRKLLIYKV